MAVKTWTGAGANNNWNTALNWSGGTIPVTGDDIIFDGAFPITGNKNCLLNVNFNALNVNFTGYTGTFTFGASLTTTSGTITLGSGTTYSTNATVTSYTLTVQGTNPGLVSNNKILPVNLNAFSSGGSFTITGNADFQGNLLTANTANSIKAATLTTVDLRIGGNITLGATTVNITDQVTIKGYGVSKKYNSNGTSTNVRVSFIAGSLYTSNGNAGLSGASFLTVESGGQFNALSANSFSGSATLSGFNGSSDFYGTAGGVTLTCLTDTIIKSFITLTASATTINCTGASKLLLEGNLTGSGGAIAFIERLEFSGTTASNVTATSGTNLQIKEFIINKTGGGSVNFNSNGIFTLFVPNAGSYSFTQTNGIVTQNSTSIVRFYCNNTAATMTYSQTNMSFRYLEFAGGTLNLNSQLVATTLRLSPLSGTITVIITSSTTFGFTVEALQVINTTGAVKTVTLKSSVIYSITAVLIMISTVSTAPITLNASTAGVKAIFNLDNSASQTVEYVNATDIDSSGTLGVMPFSKQLIYSLAGVITTTFNWSTGNQPPPIAITRTVAYTFVS